MAQYPLSFSFHESHDVRIQIIEGNPWFCLKDVCEVLTIANSRRVASEVLDLDGVRKAYITDSMDRKQEATFVNEPNLYRVIFRSNKTEAKQFQDWVFNEVLPSIRKTGRYEAFSPQAQNHREPIDNNDLANIKWLINAVTNRFKFSGKWYAAIWHSLRRATGTLSPQQFSVEDIPVLAEEFTRILTVTSSASELIGNFEKEVLKQVVRNRKDFDQIASQFKEEFESLRFLPIDIESLESFERFGLARLANRTH